jgi:hypothetical protein
VGLERLVARTNGLAVAASRTLTLTLSLSKLRQNLRIGSSSPEVQLERRCLVEEDDSVSHSDSRNVVTKLYKGHINSIIKYKTSYYSSRNPGHVTILYSAIPLVGKICNKFRSNCLHI